MWKLWAKSEDHNDANAIAAKTVKETLYDLPLNSIVRIQVKAINGAGAGPWSDATDESGARIKNKPLKMEMPTKTVTSSASQFVINWQNVRVAEAQSGFSDITEYVLEEETDTGLWVKVYGKGKSTDVTVDKTSWTKTGAVVNTKYKYRVAARNVYGISPYSDLLIATAGMSPDAP